MNKLKISLSFLLAVFILVGIQFLKPSEVQAAGQQIPFPNIQLNGDVLSWNDISNNVNGSIDVSIVDASGKGKGGRGYSSSTTELDVFSFMKAYPTLEPGTYKIVLKAEALNGNTYYYECNYAYDFHRLNEIQNLAFDGKNLTWNFSDPAVDPDAEIRFKVDVVVYLNDGSFRIVFTQDRERLTSTKLPAYSFLLDGKFNYSISVSAYSDDKRYQMSNSKSIWIEDYTPSEINCVSGIKETDGLISWDAYPGAERYDVHYRFKGNDNTSYYGPESTYNTDYYMPYYLQMFNYEHDIYVFVAAIDREGKQISSYACVKYHYTGNAVKKYPLYIKGHQLSSRDNLADLFGWSADGRATYIPSENRLVFRDFTSPVSGSSTLTDPLFYSPESITAEGTAKLTANTELFRSDKDIIFSDKCNISGKSDTSAVVASNITVKGGKIDLLSSGADTMKVSGKIKVERKISSISLETSGNSSVAVKAGDLILDNIKIAEPVNGKYIASKNTICDKDGTPARKVKLVNLEPELSLNKKTASVVCGNTLTLKASLKYSESKVSWKSSDSKTAAVDSNGKITAKKAGKVTITATAAGKSAKCTVTVLYKDVTDSSDFWYTPTNYLTAKGVVKGYADQTEFRPANICTRAQMVTFLYRLQGEPKTKATTCKFKDVKSKDYFYKPVIWAVENGITTGVSKEKFEPQKVCTRAQTVTFLWRMAGKPEPGKNAKNFPDVKKTDYFYKATLWASDKKILAGLPDGRFDPKGKCLRRQMVTFLYKYDKYINIKG